MPRASLVNYTFWINGYVNQLALLNQKKLCLLTRFHNAKYSLAFEINSKAQIAIGLREHINAKK